MKKRVSIRFRLPLQISIGDYSMAKSFEFPLATGAFDRLVRQVPVLIDKAKENGMTMTASMAGDVVSGHFAGRLAGSFRVTKDSATVEVFQKPLFASWGMVERGLSDLFSGGAA